MQKIPRGVWVLGFISLFMDVSSGMVHLVLPLSQDWHWRRFDWW